jgi:hypothetical protein
VDDEVLEDAAELDTGAGSPAWDDPNVRRSSPEASVDFAALALCSPRGGKTVESERQLSPDEANGFATRVVSP